MGIIGPKWLLFLAQNPGYSPGKIEHHADSTRLILTLYEMFMETVWRQIMSGFSSILLLRRVELSGVLMLMRGSDQPDK